MTGMGVAQAEQELEREAQLPPAESLGHELVRGSRRWDHFLWLVKQSLLLKVGLLIVAVAVFLAVFGPMLAPYDLTKTTDAVNQPPSAAHWFGTDASGFDVFSRTLASPRLDVTIALFATVLSLVLGSLVGLLASFFRGWAGEFVMRVSDTVQAFPLFVLAIVLVVMAGRHLWVIIGVVAVLNTPIYLRLIRAEVLSLRERTFIEAARANGERSLSIALRHVLPNAMAPGYAQASITFGYAILITAGLSFIGAGVQPPTAEWGSMIAAGKDGVIVGDWWPSVFPGIAMSLTVFGFAVVGDALQSVFLRRT